MQIFFKGNFNAGLLVNGYVSIARLATIVLSTCAELMKIKNNNLSTFTSLQRVDMKKEGLDHSLGSAWAIIIDFVSVFIAFRFTKRIAV